MKSTLLFRTSIFAGCILFSLVTHAKGHSELRGDFLLSKRAVSALDLTSDQQIQIKRILDNIKENKMYLKSKRKENRKTFRALIESENFDETKANTLISQIKDVRGDKMLENVKSRHQIWQLLTVDQREKLQQVRTKWKGKRHHRLNKKQSQNQ